MTTRTSETDVNCADQDKSGGECGEYQSERECVRDARPHVILGDEKVKYRHHPQRRDEEDHTQTHRWVRESKVRLVGFDAPVNVGR